MGYNHGGPLHAGAACGYAAPLRCWVGLSVAPVFVLWAVRRMRRCGPHGFRVGGLPEENKPRNILEEIVWWVAAGPVACMCSLQG